MLKENRILLSEFNSKWSLENVKKMTLEQYVDVSNKETFAQWIETKTKNLGSINGYPSKKFGIYKRRNNEYKSRTLVSDDTYSWLPFYGDNREQAFKKVHKEIIEVIMNTLAGNYNSIDKIHLNNFVKWKIAFLYSNENLLPIFTKQTLINIAKGLQHDDADNLTISELQIFIMKNKPQNLNVFDYAEHLYKKYKTVEESTSYYLVGSRYGENSDIDVSKEMEEISVVSIGFAWGRNLSYLYGKSEREIITELQRLGEVPASYNALRQFLRFKPGDIIAVKSSGSPKAGKPCLEIIAYAVVVEKDGEVYWYDSNELGHCINVEYIKTDFKEDLKLGGYGSTVHSVRKPEKIDKIFNGFKNPSSVQVRDKIKKRRRLRNSSKGKNLEGQKRKGNGGYVTNPKHNKIQVYFKEYLESQFGLDRVKLEENNVDIKLSHPDGYDIFYEVKPYDFAEDCIRRGIGQLLAYVFFDPIKSNKKIRIVGPYGPDKDEIKLIDFLKKNLKTDFDYECFEIE